MKDIKEGDWVKYDILPRFALCMGCFSMVTCGESHFCGTRRKSNESSYAGCTYANQMQSEMIYDKRQV